MHSAYSQLTIITSHFDDIEGLIKTFESINNQTFKGWQWIIIDSFTKDFFSLIPDELVNKKNINIFQLNSSIYDAMNFAILKVDSDYYQFLNCNSTYKDIFSLENIFELINCRKFTKKNIFAAGLLIRDQVNKIKIQKPNRFLFPFKCGHESTIFPNIENNKLLIKSDMGVVADIKFLDDYSRKFKIIFTNIDLINYPKGGFSDSENLFFDKLKGYFKLSLSLILRKKILPFMFCFYRIITLPKEYFYQKKFRNI